MKDVIQESEVDEILNKRRKYFTPELGRFYKVETEDSRASKYAELVSIDYAYNFPYLCNMIVREAISIDGRVEAPAKSTLLRFGCSGMSEDGNKLQNLSKEDELEIAAPLDIDCFNERSPQRILKCDLPKSGLKRMLQTDELDAFPIQWAYMFALCATCFPSASALNMSAFASWCILFVVATFMWAIATTKRARSIVLPIFTFVAIFLNICNIVHLLELNKIGWMHLIISFVSLLTLFMVTYFYAYVSRRLDLKKSRRSVFMVGHFNEFVTGDGKSVMITNKFGSDNDFPMEGYIVEYPEIRNGDTVVKERASLAVKWNYSGHPAKYSKNDVEFDNYTLYNTPEDAKVVTELFDKQCSRKSNSKTGKVSEKTENNGDASGKRAALFSRIALVANGLWSTKSGKFACLVLTAWVINFIFGR